MNPIHRRARTNDRIETEDRLVGVLVGQALHHVDLCAYSKDRSCRCSFNSFPDQISGSVLVRGVYNFHRAFGVNDDSNAGMTNSSDSDLLHRKTFVNRAETMPQNYLRLAKGPRIQSTHGTIRIPNGHLLQRNAHYLCRIPSEMLVREEENPLSAFERPFEYRLCIG